MSNINNNNNDDNNNNNKRHLIFFQNVFLDVTFFLDALDFLGDV